MKRVKYSIVYRDENGVEHADEFSNKTYARKAFRDGKEVTKITRQVTQSGPTTVVVIISTEIQQSKEI